MIQCEGRKEGCSPAAQAGWCLNIRSKGITPTKQQITTCIQRQHCHCCIKYNKERIFPDLIVHENLQVIAEFAEAGFVGFAEFADGFVADLAYTLTFDVEVFGNLSHRLVLLPNTEDGIDDFRLTAIE